MRKVWRSARERKRREARFIIRERVASVACDTNTSTSSGCGPAELQNEKEHEKATTNHQNEAINVSPNSITDKQYHDDLESPALPLHPAKQQQCLQEERKRELQRILDKIHTGARSFFSVTLMADQFDVLSAPVSSAFLLEHLPRERIVSCFGSPYLELLGDYLSSFHTISVMEYTVLIGRYLITGALLLGGLSPCRPRSSSLSQDTSQYHPQQERHLERVSHQILQRFFDFFPLSLSSYIVKRVVDMRLTAATSTWTTTNDERTSQTHPATFTCQLCQERIPACYRLVFTTNNINKSNNRSNNSKSETCCGCSFCEACFWKDILQNIDARIGDQDVVLCPCCSSTPSLPQLQQNSDVEIIAATTVPMDPRQRSEASKYEFDLLPFDSKALKGLGGKKRKKKIPEAEYLSKTWAMAVVPSLGMCQSVRQDKLFTYTEKCALQYVHGCLERGVHVNATNEYGQTPLYMATWHGDLALVELLLEYGASPWVNANGHLTLDGICRAHGHEKIHDRIQQFRKEYWPASTPTTVHSQKHDLIAAPLESLRLEDGVEPFLEVLIGLHHNHPGAGSFLIHDCIQSVDSLVQLWQGLPIDQTSSKTAKKAGTCADRSYYCDAEGKVARMLKSRLVRAFCLDGSVNIKEKDIKVLPQMRFLNYQCIGSSLSPHVDLCRVDRASGQRSSHSFLLYLTTCDTGGETTLLENLTGEKALAIVKPTTGHLLLFPHDCPHEGNVVQHVPKLLIRGEVILYLEDAQSHKE